MPVCLINSEFKLNLYIVNIYADSGTHLKMHTFIYIYIYIIDSMSLILANVRLNILQAFLFKKYLHVVKVFNRA